MDAPTNEEEGMPWKEIVAQAVHDMRTPLSSLRTSVEVLRMISCESADHDKLIAMMDNQLGELAVQLDTLQNDPLSFLRRSAPAAVAG